MKLHKLGFLQTAVLHNQPNQENVLISHTQAHTGKGIRPHGVQPHRKDHPSIEKLGFWTRCPLDGLLPDPEVSLTLTFKSEVLGEETLGWVRRDPHRRAHSDIRETEAGSPPSYRRSV